MKLEQQAFVRPAVLLSALAWFTAGLAFAIVGGAALDQTSSVEFCTSCHTMSLPFEEYQQTEHFQNKYGTPAGCSDCHVPKALGPLLVAKVMAARDVMHEVLGTIETPELYEEHRWRMANRVWDKMLATDSRECRSCHVFEQMDLDEQDRRTAKKHRKAEAEGETCIECHKGVAHKLPDPPEEEPLS